MDKRKAEELYKQIKGEKIEEIVVEELENYGKSAAVFRGRKDNELFAIKIFDNDVVRSDEVDVHQQRINLELNLKEHKIPSLVKIIGGGETSIKNIDYYYLIMEFVKGMNLKDYIKTESYDVNFIVSVVNILFDVTEKLFQEKEPIAHRDIKPANIMVAENGEIILMDMGVIKIVGNPSFTDVEKKEFLGTLKYASPEFLMREEEDSINGWRALNIYQIGAVLYELIMKKEIFAGVEPFANLVKAIDGEMPKIISSDYHPELIQMTRNMLQKGWRKRLEKTPVNGINEALERCKLPPADEVSNIYDKIRIKALPIQAQIDEINSLKRTNEEKKKIILETNNNIWKYIDGCLLDLPNNGIITSVEKTEVFSLKLAATENMKTTYKIYRIKGNFDQGFAHPVLLLFDVANDENNYCTMYVAGIIPDDLYIQDIKDPNKMIFSVYGTGMKYKPVYHHSKQEKITITFSFIFDDIIELEDNSLKAIIDKTNAMIIEKAVDKMRHDVQEKLKNEMEYVSSEHSGSYSQKRRPIFIQVGKEVEKSFWNF